MPIKDLPNNLRPREKALTYGVASLNDIELMAIILRNGTSKSDVLDISKKLLSKFKTIHNIFNTDFLSLTNEEGIGAVKALEIIAIMELNKRINHNVKISFDNLDNVINFASNEIASSDKEIFLILLLDAHNNFLYFEKMYIGSASSVSICPKEIIALAIKKDAKKFYCFHNHPSGNHQPSFNDKLLTKKILNYSQLFSIEFLAHIVLTKNGNYAKVDV